MPMIARLVTGGCYPFPGRWLLRAVLTDEAVGEAVAAPAAGRSWGHGTTATGGAVHRAPAECVCCPDAGELAVLEWVAMLLGHRGPVGSAANEG
jgi:hypothetical protein